MRSAKWRRAVGLILVVGFLWTHQQVSGADEGQYEDQNWYKMATLRYKLKNDLYGFSLEADRSKAAALASGNCDSINYARFADMLNKISRSDTWTLDAELAASECEWEGSPLFHLAALEAFGREDYKQAESYFRQALAFAEHEIYQTEVGAREGLAAALANQFRFEEALDCLQKIYDTDPQNIQPNTLNNFAFFSLAMGECEESVTWAELALDRLNVLKGPEANFDLQHAGQWNVSYHSLLNAGLAMGDRELAGRAFGGLNLKHQFDGRESMVVAAVTLYCQWLDNPELFRLMRPDLIRLLGDRDPTTDGQVLGANVALFEPEDSAWQADWEQCRSVPVLFRGGTLGMCPAEAQVALGKSTTAPLPYPELSIAGGVLLLLMLVAFGRQFRLHSRLRELSAEPRGVWQSIVEDQLAKSPHSSLLLKSDHRARALAAFNLLLHSVPSKGLERLPNWSEWSEMEQRVAQGLALGERTKAIASRLDITLPQVYSIRQSIRERLGLSEDETLEKWLKSQAE